MAIFSKESKLSEIILENPSVIQMMERFGIFLGVGDMTVRQACEKKEIDETLFLAIVNTFLNRNYFPESLVGKVALSPLLDYLEKTDLYYRDVLLPNIHRHFTLLLTKSDPANLQLLQRFFIEVREEMLDFIAEDLEKWLPYFRNREEGKLSSMVEEEASNRTFDNFVLEEKISDLINFFVIHLRGEYDHNLCVAVVLALDTLKKDVQQNNRIRNRIMKPLCQGSH